MKRLIPLLITCSSIYHLSAQPDIYQTETIYLHTNTYVRNEQVYPIGFIGGNLKREMSISREGMVVFQRYQRQRTVSLILGGAGLAVEVIALSLKPESQFRNGFVIGGLACAVISIPFSINADRNLNRAVWIRNGDVLK